MPKLPNMSDVVVIGGVAAGPKTAATLARRRPGVRITLFQREEYLSYATCGLPYFASGEVGSFDELLKTSWGSVSDAAYFENAKGFNAVTRAEVVKINREGKTVTVKMLDTDETVEHGYGRLVIATGAVPQDPPMPVPKSDRVRPFTQPADALNFRALAERGEVGEAVIIGGGFIGVELCEAVKDMWGIEVKLFEKQPQLLPYMLDPDMAELVQRSFTGEGVGVSVNATVKSVDLDADGKPVVSVAGQDPVTADYVFLCLGVRPEVTLARECGLDIGETGGIMVDRYMCTSDPDIYAGGDCIESRHQLTGHAIYLPMGSLANRHGRVIAGNVARALDGESARAAAGGNVGQDAGAGEPPVFPGVLGAFVLRAFETHIGGVGSSEEAARADGFDVRAVWGTFADRPDYNPEMKTITLKMVYENATNRLLGLQAVGKGDISRRIDVFSSLLQQEACVNDIFDFEHSYAPPFAEALDPLHHMAGIAEAVGRGARFVGPDAYPSSIDAGTIILDVRQTEETETTPLPADAADRCAEVIAIPLDQLRGRLGEL
ncbi:MAG: FAD-dependent oxidoreductase, partial [Candidatus Latescibacterota bacterium]